MQTVSEYDKQATDFLAGAGIEFRAVLVGNDCPPFCEDAQAEKDMDKVDVYPRKTHIHGKHYRCTFSKKDRGHFAVDFWNSYNDAERNWAVQHSFEAKDIYVRPQFGGGRSISLFEKHASTNRAEGRKIHLPQPYDVLTCITKDDPGTFEQFCGEFGYDTDSRRAEDTYRAVVKEWQKVQRFFTAEELEAVRGIQ